MTRTEEIRRRETRRMRREYWNGWIINYAEALMTLSVIGLFTTISEMIG